MAGRREGKVRVLQSDDVKGRLSRVRKLRGLVQGKRNGAKPALTFTEQFYYPEGWGGAQLLQDITVHLAQSGFDVRVICGSEQYAPVEGDAAPDPSRRGVAIVRLPRLIGGDIHSNKLLRQLWFYLLTLPATVLSERPALFITQTNPPLVVPLMALVARVRAVPLVVIAQDLYPELVIAHGMLRRGSVQARMLERIFDWAYQSAERVVSLGPAMTQRLRAKGVHAERISEIPNWAAGPQEVVRGDANCLRREWNLEGKFVLLYSGNLGVAHDIETPILALREAVKQRPEIRLVIIGKGVRIQEAKMLVERNALQDFVLFKSLVPMEMLPQSIGLADLALVTLGRDFAGLVVPSKLLGYMARGIPTLYVGPSSEISSTLSDSEGGMNFANGQSAALADALIASATRQEALQKMGEAARHYYEERLTREVALERYLRLVDTLVQESRPEAAETSGG
jgi:colanic acid biosynthesis glycosyl transferase WcaI